MNDKEEIKGLYLNCRTRENLTDGIFNYSTDKPTIDINTFITDKKCKIVKSEYDKNLNFYSDTSRKDLFTITINNDKTNFLLKYNLKNASEPLKRENLKNLNNKLWFIINSDIPEFNSIKNDDYYLEENDIIKLGRKKFIISEIHIQDKKDINKKAKIQIFDFYQECKEIKNCECCGKLMIKLCDCKEYYHFDEIKKWIETRVNKNFKKNVKNYNFTIYYCKDIIQKDPGCTIDEHKNNCKCIYCDTYYRLKFKVNKKLLEGLKLEDEKEEKEEEEEISFKNEIYKTFNFYKLEKPKNKDYMIMESFEDIDRDNNNSNVIKSIHIIELNDGEEIKIGRNIHNDIIISDGSVSGDHAFIKYDKKTGKILLKNLSKKAGTLALINGGGRKFSLSEKPIFIQGGQSFFELQIISESEYLKNKKNSNSIFPLVLIEEKTKK